MEIKTIENLLHQVNAISKKYDEIAELTGENFNVFRILKLETNEVRTHSAFIAELLNPKGTHGRGNLFLKEFINILKKKVNILLDKPLNEILFDEDNVKEVKVEQWLGYIKDIEGGYIDILLTDHKNQSIIIENKINALDQKNQLLRYHSSNQNAPIVYLTLDGRNPSPDSTDNRPYVIDKLICISYQEHILTWIEECKKHAVDLPILRETLTQYIYLIKQLTNQTTNVIMKEEIVKLIVSNEENIKTFFELQREDIINSVRKPLILKLEAQMEELAQKLNLSLKFDSDFGFNTKGSKIYFYLNNSKKRFYIAFGFCVNFSNMFYVVNCDREFIESCKDEVCNRIGNRDKHFNEIWINWMDSEFRSWEISPLPWLAILNGELKENFKGKIERIINSLEGFEI